MLEHVLLVYELVAIEGSDELCHSGDKNNPSFGRAVTASSRAFEIRRLMPVPTETHDKIFFVLHLSALAYCNDSRCYIAHLMG